MNFTCPFLTASEWLAGASANLRLFAIAEVRSFRVRSVGTARLAVYGPQELPERLRVFCPRSLLPRREALVSSSLAPSGLG